MRSDYKPKNQKGKLLYDARGRQVQNRNFLGSFRRILLFYLLPYFVINGIIFALVTATPKIDIKVGDTNDYKTAQVTFTVKSLLPLKSLKADIESKEIPFEKSGSTYTANVDMNGTFYVEALSINGIHSSQYVDVSVLDQTPPVIDPEDCVITAGGDLRFTITDSQSGINYDAIYGIYDGNKEVRPLSYDRETGVVVIPLYTNSLQIHAEDMAGNVTSIDFAAAVDDESDGDETEAEASDSASDPTEEDGSSEPSGEV